MAAAGSPPYRRSRRASLIRGQGSSGGTGGGRGGTGTGSGTGGTVIGGNGGAGGSGGSPTGGRLERERELRRRGRRRERQRQRRQRRCRRRVVGGRRRRCRRGEGSGRDGSRRRRWSLVRGRGNRHLRLDRHRRRRRWHWSGRGRDRARRRHLHARALSGSPARHRGLCRSRGGDRVRHVGGRLRRRGPLRLTAQLDHAGRRAAEHERSRADGARPAGRDEEPVAAAAELKQPRRPESQRAAAADRGRLELGTERPAGPKEEHLDRRDRCSEP